MSLGVNFSTHSKDLSAAYQAVISDSDPTNWLVYAYDKKTNDLRVQDTGDGGLEELYDEFNDGKVQYALARVIDPNSQLPKIVFVGWCGTGVPENRKAFFNSHLSEVSRFFKTFHVQINARDEADVEPELIMKRVSESSGSKYSVHKETAKPQPAVTPVNSVYKKTEIPDIAAMQRESMKKEGPPARVGTNYQPVQTAPKPLASRWASNISSSTQDSGAAAVRAERERAEREAREREEQSVRERELIEKQRAAEQERQYQQQYQQQQEAENLQRLKEQEQQQEEENRKHAEEQERQRQAAAEEEERQRQTVAREQEHQRQIAAEQERERQAAAEQDRQRQIAEEQRKAAEEQRKAAEEQRKVAEEQQRLLEEQQRKAESEKLQREEQEKQQQQSTTSSPKGVSAVVLFSYDAGEANEMALVEGEVIVEIDQVDEGWWYGISEDGKKQGLFPANYVEVLQEDHQHTTAAAANDTTNVQEEQHYAPTATATTHTEDLGHTAIGLYDYQAGEDNEISFKENQRITNIEFVSEDWWQGLAPDGKTYGLFPSNYVNLEQ
ncbi:hypothetical protein BJ944DRAFT_249125 [Cunninghamella echinulata]|nr:hypothetical protein BJ944DRAFT_249125 [Cunninghamella echinulata]